ncbi:MAG: glutamate synthase-related protein [Candidatus Thermoplasmatota archaeon]|nr:glutamate synthase-related protein [Candidatus Thermoplasmatota archaeon]
MLESTGEGTTTTSADTLTLEKFGSESARIGRELADQYHRYHIDTEEVDDVDPLPHRFLVEVGKVGLAKFILSEVFHYGLKPDVILSRPCTYGVFSGPVGGFAPRPKLCVGCLRCTVQHPDFVKVLPNPERLALGDKYTTHGHIAAIDEESKKGMVPVRGQGYRGRFGGPGFDGMLTDMSEIVRPSRDGIHGRELIGTSVDIGTKPMHLSFDSDGKIVGKTPEMFTIQVPFVFDVPPGDLSSHKLAEILDATSKRIDTLACMNASDVLEWGLDAPHIVPIVSAESPDSAISFPNARLIEIDAWNKDACETVRSSTEALVGVRIEFTDGWQEVMMKAVNNRVDVIHLNADLHGRGTDGRFVSDLLKEAHMLLIEKGCRDMVTLIGSGGIVSADHLPKAIISGLDAVALDLPVLFALQGRSHGSLETREGVKGTLPRKMTKDWAEQRLTNLCGSWRDQLLEILGAMGIREVRRLRGEFGRSMIVTHLEDEAFEGIEGYVSGGAA